MSVLQMFAVVADVILGLLVLLWLVSLALKNSSIIDVFWGAGFVVAAWLYYGVAGGGPRGLLLAWLVTIWGLRLSLYILWRNLDKGEDFRYRKWREESRGSWWWQSFFRVFMLQGILLLIISTPLLMGQRGGAAALTVLDGLGALVWLVGFFFEAVGDWQLARFKADPANQGKVMDRGVWRYTRHPNYFGDAAQWWGFFLIAAGAPGGAWTFFSPLLMTVLLLRVSGVSLLESTLSTRPGYAEYIRRTSPFLPWPPKK